MTISSDALTTVSLVPSLLTIAAFVIIACFAVHPSRCFFGMQSSLPVLSPSLTVAASLAHRGSLP